MACMKQAPLRAGGVFTATWSVLWMRIAARFRSFPAALAPLETVNADAANAAGAAAGGFMLQTVSFPAT